MKINKKITAFLLVIVVCMALSLSALGSGIMGGAGINASSSDGGFSGMNGTSLTDGMTPRADSDNENNSTLGDIDGDGVIENENGLMPGYSDRDAGKNSRNGTDPISESTQMSENGTSDTADSAMSWTAIIVAVLLAAALVAVVIALIPKRRDDRH